MVYSRLSLDAVIDANHGISVADMTEKVVEHHAAQNGCTFEANAAQRAVSETGLPRNALASSLSENDRKRLARVLEEFETHCEHKGGEDEGMRDVIDELRRTVQYGASKCTRNIDCKINLMSRGFMVHVMLTAPSGGLYHIKEFVELEEFSFEAMGRAIDEVVRRSQEYLARPTTFSIPAGDVTSLTSELAEGFAK